MSEANRNEGVSCAEASALGERVVGGWDYGMMSDEGVEQSGRSEERRM